MTSRSLKIFYIQMLASFCFSASCKPKGDDQPTPTDSAEIVNLKAIKDPTYLFIKFSSPEETEDRKGLHLGGMLSKAPAPPGGGVDGFSKLRPDEKTVVYKFMDIESITALQATSKQNNLEILGSNGLRGQGREFVDVSVKEKLKAESVAKYTGKEVKETPTQTRLVEMYDQRLTNFQSADLMRRYLKAGGEVQKLDTTPLLGTKIYPDLPAEILAQIADDINASRVEGIHVGLKYGGLSPQELEFLKNIFAHNKIKELTWTAQEIREANFRTFLDTNHSIETISLNSMSFDDGAVAAIAGKKNLKSLSVKVHDPGVLAGTPAALAANPTIRSFEMEATRGTGGLEEYLAENQHLERVALFVNENRPTVALFEALRTNTKVTSFATGSDDYLNFLTELNRDMPMPADTQAALLRALSENRTLTSLGLPGLALDELQVKNIVLAMQGSHITDLDIRASRLGKFSEVAPDLENYGRFTRLDFSGSEIPVNNKMIKQMAKIITGNPKLAELNLSDLQDTNRNFNISAGQLKTLAAAASEAGHARLTIDIRERRPPGSWNEGRADTAAKPTASELAKIAETYPNVVILH